MGISITINCSTCNGDGYLSIDLQAWEKFKVWMDDKTEDKIQSPDAFPEALKRVHTLWGLSIGKTACLPCPDCGGQRVITKEVSFDELKNMIK